jgi:hypothetical protein
MLQQIPTRQQSCGTNGLFFGLGHLLVPLHCNFILHRKQCTRISNATLSQVFQMNEAMNKINGTMHKTLT